MKPGTCKDTPLQNGLREHYAVSDLNYVIDLFQVVTDFSSFVYKFIITFNLDQIQNANTVESFSYIPENAWIT